MFKANQAPAAAQPAEDGRRTEDVARLSGVSLRQLQWWDEQGVVSPVHRGHRRLYRTEEVVEVMVIAELRRKGFSLQKIRRVLRFLHKEMGKRLFDAVKAGAEMNLLTDGRHIYLEDNDRRIVNILKNARQPLIAVCVSDHVRRITSPPPPKKPGREVTAIRVRAARATG
jgi:DNA-binding transcriptional MerR regulator